ncbi:MAG: formylglycine-generating enzyme family protein [Phycisphaerae bacterium]|jgi:formylglycine-generating enzyme required for sulfatase activity|nr:formylglycine-generating enzyme family protein [Phycisphaerae bacterium]
MWVRSATMFFLVATISVTTTVLAAPKDDKPPTAPAKPKADISTWAKPSPAQAAAAKKLGVPVAFENSVGIRFILIPPGTFMMGSKDSAAEVATRCAMPNAAPGWFVDEHPRHKVTLTKAFYMSIHEVTNASYEAITAKPKPKNKPKNKKPETPVEPKNPTDPAVSISWSIAEKVCKDMSSRDKRKYALPTEAQWEYACRAGTETPFSFGEAASTDQANYHGDYIYGKGKKGKNRGKPAPVGSMPPNAWGLYEMHGNVSEWCADKYSKYTGDAATDPTGPDEKAKGSDRLLRGGSWRSYPGACRSAFRHKLGAGTRSEAIGFRVVCALPSDDPPPKAPPKK